MQAEAFTSGGPTELTDRKDPADDYVVRSTSYDVQALVTQVYDLFYAGNIPGVFALLSPDAAVYFRGKDNPQSGEYVSSPRGAIDRKAETGTTTE